MSFLGPRASVRALVGRGQPSSIIKTHNIRITPRIVFRPFTLTNSSKTMSKTIQIPVPGTDRSVSIQTGLFIDNEFVPSVDGLTIE